MARYVLFAFNGPTSGEGDEAKYNRWYDEIHLPDIKSVKGVKSARRFKVVGGKMPGMENWPYAAIYEIETDDLQAVFKGLETSLRPYSPTLNRDKSASLVAMQISDD